MEDQSTWYCKNNGINQKVVGMSGLMDTADPYVLVRLSNKVGKRGHVIRKGDVLGRVSTVTKTAEENEPGETWTEEELRHSEKISVGEELTVEERQEVLQMLWEHHSALSKGEFDMGQAAVSPQRIELINEAPIWIKPRKFLEPINQEIERQCQELLESNVIEHSESPFSAAIVPVSKRDGSLRMCVDNRKLNDITKTEISYSEPNRPCVSRWRG